MRRRQTSTGSEIRPGRRVVVLTVGRGRSTVVIDRFPFADGVAANPPTASFQTPLPTSPARRHWLLNDFLIQLRPTHTPPRFASAAGSSLPQSQLPQTHPPLGQSSAVRRW